EGYESGNVSQLINGQTFSVYEITTYPDGAWTKTINTYDALQRLQSAQVITGNASASAYPVGTTTYKYPVNVNQLGEGPNGDLTYHNYGLLPPNFNKPTQVQTTSFPLFNGNLLGGTDQITTTVNQYDAHGNLTRSTVSSGVSKTYTYYQGTIPCGINPYITSICTTPSPLPSVGILGPLSAAQFVTPGSSPQAITNNTSNTSYTTMFGGGVILPLTQTSVLNVTIEGPIMRTHNYDSLGRVNSVIEIGDFGTCTTCTQTMSYSLDAQGNQTITTANSYTNNAGCYVTDPTLPTTEVVDFLGRTISSTDNLGRTTLYQYDSLGRITQETQMANLPPAQQLVTRYAYEIIAGNASTVGGTRTTVTTPNGAQVIYTFDCVGRQTSNQIKPVNGTQRFVRSFSYDPETRDGGPCGNQMTASTTYIADGSSITVDYYYNGLGDLIATIPLAGAPGLAQATLNLVDGNYAYALTFNFTYNPSNSGSTTSPITAYGLASLVQKDAMTGATTNIYNFDSQSTLQFGSVSSGANLNKVLSGMNFSSYLLNADLSVNTAALMTVANSATTTAYTYDTLFRLVDETLTGAGTGKSLTTTRGYDRNGRLAHMQDPKGNVFTLASDGPGNPTQLSVLPAGGKSYYLATASYNAAGQKTSYANTPSTTANVNPITYTYDPTTGMQTSETDALGNTIHYLFYPTGLLAAAWSQVATGYYLWTVVKYDKYGSVLSQWNGPIATQPSLTNLTPCPADAIYSYTYNIDGQLATKTVQYADQQPCTTTYGYDDCGNMNTYTDPFGQTISASLDPYGRQSAMQATVNGKLLHQLQFAYDSLGRLSSLAKTSHQSCQTPQGVAESFQIQSNRSYSYDHLLRTVGVSDQTATPNLSNNGLTNFGQNLKYNLWGNVTANNLQFLDQNGSVLGELDQGYTYDQFDRLTAYNVSPSDASFLPGDVKGHKIVAQTFAYDVLDNLQSVMTAYLDGTSTAAPVTTETVTYGYNASLPFQLESVTGYSAMAYDTLGRATTDAYGNGIAYDAAGYMNKITQTNGEVISYGYGPDRMPFSQTSSDGTSLYTYLTDNNVTARADNTGNTVIKTLIGFGGPTQFTTLDLLGNPVLTKSYQAEYPNLNAQVPTVQESVSLQNVYSPTGIQTNLKAANPTAGYPQNLQPATGKGSPLLVENLTGGGLGLNNEMTDPLTGYQILGGYRAYDPNLGRFNKPDSFAPGIAGLNPYAYTGNRFVGCSDPTGHYTYTYKSYGVAKRSIKRRIEAKEHQGLWQQIANSYKSVLVNLIKHPTNPSSYVAAAMLAANPASPIMAAVVSQLGQASPVGAVIEGAYDGVLTAVDGTCTMGVVKYNPQTGLGSLNTGGAGNLLGMMSLGYLNMSPNGVVQTHAGHSFLTHLKHEGYGAADMLENIIGGIAGVGIGLCYDMPADFIKGEYYMAGYALGMNTAMLVSMIAAPEDAPAEAGAVDAEADAASAEEAAAATKARTAAKELEKLSHNKAEAFTQKYLSSAEDNFRLVKSADRFVKSVDRTFSGKIGSKAVRMIKAKRFTDYAAEFLGGKIGSGITSLGTYSNLNMTDPRSPWSTAAWQNILYRQGPYTPDKN
ncbi:MAG: RHS repeat-associated core domain-containing protein, partial [Candidatus Methylumidiphilus sp.]